MGTGRGAWVQLADLGPTFVKFGQLIASSAGLFPDVLSEEMRRLLDDVPPGSPSQVRSLVEHELGAPLGELFASFEDDPVGAASIAQIHRARLHDGRTVAVKVRRPRLHGRISRDLRLLWVLASVFERIGSLGELANPSAMVDDFAAGLRGELDFRNEAASMIGFVASLRTSTAGDGVVVPQPITRIAIERVIVMTFIDGTPVDRLVAAEHGHLDWEDLPRRGIRAWMQGALEFGLFHGDVHAGNLFVTGSGDLAFLDFGIMGELARSTRTVLRDALPACSPRRRLRTLRVGILRARRRDRFHRHRHRGRRRAPAGDAASREVALGDLLRRDPLPGSGGRHAPSRPVPPTKPPERDGGAGLVVVSHRDASFATVYGSDHPGLEKLYSKAKRSQWNASTDIDWSIDVDPLHTGDLAEYLPLIASDAFTRFSGPERANAYTFNAWSPHSSSTAPRARCWPPRSSYKRFRASTPSSTERRR
jgi:hypothetical protein